MRKFASIAFATFIVFFQIHLHAATITAISSGNWGNPAKWDLGRIPACGDYVIIPAAFTITVNAPYVLDNTATPTACNTAERIDVYGTLTFNNDPSYLRLACGSTVYIYAGGVVKDNGSGNSCQLYICGAQVYSTTGCSAPCSTGTITGSSPPKTFTSSGLPIKLAYFNSRLFLNQINLSWSTYSEINFDYFSIEKSVNGTSFFEIGKVRGHGTTVDTHSYEFVDEKAVIGKNYYRLKSVDFDGYVEYFDVISVDFTMEKQFSLYPNPADGKTIKMNINFIPDQPYTIFILDNFGSEVAKFSSNQDELVVQFANPLSSGIYFSKIISNGFTKTIHFVVLP